MSLTAYELGKEPVNARTGFLPNLEAVHPLDMMQALGCITTPQIGISLRQHFAGLALAALVTADAGGVPSDAWGAIDGHHLWRPGAVYATLAVQLADALLVQLAMTEAGQPQYAKDSQPPVPTEGTE